MLHPSTELRFVSAEIGYGVFATAPIPKGTVTWVLDPLDQVFPPGDPRLADPRLGALIERYSFQTAAGDRVLCWDFGRYLNHCCEPTCGPSGLGWEVALRDLAAGEELTNDYAGLNLEAPFFCGCGHPRCRGEVSPGDLETLAAAWDRQVRDALPALARVPQPLWGWIPDPARAEHLARSPGDLPPLAGLRFPGALPPASAG